MQPLRPVTGRHPKTLNESGFPRPLIELSVRPRPRPSLLHRKAYPLTDRYLISTLSRPGRVNSKDGVVLRDGLKRGYRRVVLDRRVVPTTRGDLAPSLKDELSSLEAFRTPAAVHPLAPAPGRHPKTLNETGLFTPRLERGRASNFAGDSAKAERSAAQHAHPHRAFRLANRSVSAQS